MPLADYTIANIQEKAEQRYAGGRGNVNTPESTGYTLLHFAVELGAIDTVRYLLEKCRANTEVEINGFKLTPLHRAAINAKKEPTANRLGILQLLIQHGAQVEAKCSLGYTARQYFCDTGKKSPAPLPNSAELFDGWVASRNAQNTSRTASDAASTEPSSASDEDKTHRDLRRRPAATVRTDGYMPVATTDVITSAPAPHKTGWGLGVLAGFQIGTGRKK